MATQDFTTDDSMAFLLLLKEANALPDWLESAPETDDVKALPNVAFADTHNRMMPIHSKSAAFLSAVGACVYDYPSSANWENRLKAACENYGITEFVKAAHAALAPAAPQEKEASSDVPYALELIIEPGQAPTRFYPIGTADQVETSAFKMANDLFEEKLPGTWFAEAADKLLKAARELGVKDTSIPEKLRRIAEDRLPSPEYLQEQIDRRQKQANLQADAIEIYKEAASAALQGEAGCVDAAHVWELADRKLGIRYGATIATPIACFRSGMRKESFDKIAGSVISIADVQIPFNQLTTLSDELVAAVLPLKVASVVLQAKQQDDGLKAAGILNELGESEQLAVLHFLTESYRG